MSSTLTRTTHVHGVCWIARDPATVEDQVRFLAWTLFLACECDGLARLTSNQLDRVRLLGGLLLDEWRNWYTHELQNLAPSGMGVRLSPRSLAKHPTDEYTSGAGRKPAKRRSLNLRDVVGSDPTRATDVV